MDEKRKEVVELQARKDRVLQMGGSKAIERQHQANKLTARERIDLLFDRGSFHEIDMLAKQRGHLFGLDQREIPADALVCGYGQIEGRKTVVMAQDFTSLGGTFGEMHGLKACKALDSAAKTGSPFIQLMDSGGARIQEGLDAAEQYAQLFRRHILYSGVIPQISVIMGSCGGGAAYGPALTDFVIMTKGTSRMFMGGPAFVQSMLAEVKSADELGGPRVHSEITGLCDLLADSDEHALELTRELLAFLPSTNRQRPGQTETKDRPERKNEGILENLPVSSKRGYDMHRIISEIVDDGYFFRLKPDYARNMITGFARLNGRPVGILANQPGVKGGVIDVHAAGKHARFVQLCDCFNIPLLYLQDSPGVLIGQEEEYRGIIKIGSKMLHANTQATVPKLSLIIRHAYAAAPSCMCSKAMGADFVFAWPTAELALVGAEAAASLLNAKEIAAASDPEQLRLERIREYEEFWVNPYRAAERGYVDDVIHPEDTRRVLIDALELIIEKREEHPWKKHGNIQM